MKEYLEAMLHGPGAFRGIVQPALAVVLGVLHGLRDHRAGRPPYFLDLYRSRGSRVRRMREGFHDVLLPFCIAMLVSFVFQYIVRSHVRFVFALVYAVLFVAVPYFLARAATNRVAGRSGRVARKPA